MSIDARWAVQHGLTDSIRATKYELPKIEMNIGRWHFDEFGNKTREITARDTEEEVRVREQPEPRNRIKKMRSAAARLAQLTAF